MLSVAQTVVERYADWWITKSKRYGTILDLFGGAAKSTKIHTQEADQWTEIWSQDLPNTGEGAQKTIWLNMGPMAL
jgi:hypothetical protein